MKMTNYGIEIHDATDVSDASASLSIIDEIKTCPNLPEFKFKGGCCIDTCQYHTKLKQPNCLKLFRSEGTSRITDVELCLYKHPSKTPRYSGALRKRALTRVKNIAALYKYVLWIQDTYTESTGLPYTEGASIAIDEALASYPLNIQELGFKPWILLKLLSQETYARFLLENLQFKNSEINLKNMLDLAPKKLAKLTQDVTSMSSKSYQHVKKLNLLQG